MIIGLTGKNAAGKGESAKYLQSKEFICFSLSDILREKATEKGLDHRRETLIALGNKFRQKDPAFLAIETNNKIAQAREKIPESDIVIDSVRSPAEVKELETNKDFMLIGIDAPIEMRFERMKKRQRQGDAETLDDFRKQEELENTDDSKAQQIGNTLILIDVLIINDGTIEELHRKLYKILEVYHQ